MAWSTKINRQSTTFKDIMRELKENKLPFNMVIKGDCQTCKTSCPHQGQKTKEPCEIKARYRKAYIYNIFRLRQREENDHAKKRHRKAKRFINPVIKQKGAMLTFEKRIEKRNWTMEVVK